VKVCLSYLWVSAGLDAQHGPPRLLAAT